MNSMKKFSTCITLLGSLLMFGCGQQTDLANTEKATDAGATVAVAKTSVVDAEKEYERITSEFEVEISNLKTALAACNSDSEKQELFNSSNPLPKFLKTLETFAKSNGDSEVGLKAALEIVSRTKNKGARDDSAMQLLIENFSGKLNYSELVLTFHRDVPSPQVENWFNLLVEHSTNNDDKITAILGMAKYIDRIPEFAQGFIKNPHLLAKLPQDQQDYLQAVRKSDQDKHLADLLNEVVANKNVDKSLAKIAKQELFELQFLSVGKQVPEVTGKDLDGIEFKLSDYRGKVVLLDFWGHWCPPCRAMYGQERDLVEKLGSAPFVLLGVNSDRKLEDARDVVEGEGLTWRHFWNGPRGTEGSIASQWNIESWPTVYLIDGDGIIRHKNLLGEDLDRAVENLLAEAGHAVDLQVN